MKSTPKQIPPDIVGYIRVSATNGAASLLGHSNDAVQEIAAKTVEKFHVQTHRKGPTIKNPRAWAYRVARNEAISWLRYEARHVPLDDAISDQNEHVLNGSLEKESGIRWSGIREREEVLQALPELFDWFEARVINELEPEDRLFYKLFFLDRWTEDQIATSLNISTKAVAQRWRRLLVRMRRKLVAELPEWDCGNELFIEAFQDPKSLGDLLCLIRLFVEEGIEAIKTILASFLDK